MSGLEAAHLEIVQTPGGTLLSFGPASPGSARLGQAGGLHVAAHRGVGRNRAQVGFFPGQGDQVVVMEPVAPLGMIPVLGA
jgi:hypothetical protein